MWRATDERGHYYTLFVVSIWSWFKLFATHQAVFVDSRKCCKMDLLKAEDKLGKVYKYWG